MLGALEASLVGLEVVGKAEAEEDEQ